MNYCYSSVASTWAAFFSATALVLSVVLVLKILFLRPRWKLNLPPGPKPWPVVGSLNLMGPLPHRSLHKLSKAYGPVMHLLLGSAPVVVASSADMAKLFLRTHDLVFASRPRTAAGVHTTYSSDITWSPYGPYWRQARKICAMELFSPRRIDSFQPVRLEEVRSLLHGLFASSGKPINLKDRLSTVSLNAMTRMLLGKRCDDIGGMSTEEYKGWIEELFVLNGVLNIGDFIPWAEFLDLQGYVRRMKAVTRRSDAFLDQVIDEHDKMRREANYTAKDMIDVLLQLVDDPNLEIKLTRNSIKGFFVDLIAGGTESFAIVVEWAMSELLRHPHDIAIAAEELDRLIGKERWVEEEDIPNLPYIEAIVKETLRLHPVSPLLAPHLAREQCKVDGYDIPAGARVLVNVWAIGRDPEVWDSPLEFRPKRFVGKAIDVKGQDYELLPFGSGRRMCPGYNLGLKMVHSVLANLLHGFEWRLPDGVPPEGLDMDEVFGLSCPRKVPLQVVASPRLVPLVLYGA